MLIEAGARIAGNPAHYPVGSRIEVPEGAGDSNSGNPAIAFTVTDDEDFIASGDYDGQRCIWCISRSMTGTRGSSYGWPARSTICLRAC